MLNGEGEEEEAVAARDGQNVEGKQNESKDYSLGVVEVWRKEGISESRNGGRKDFPNAPRISARTPSASSSGSLGKARVQSDFH